MEYIQAYNFIIKHKKGVAIKVADALSRRSLTIQETRLETMGINAIKDMYEGDEDFSKAFHVCKEMTNSYHTNFANFILQEGFLFKGSQLCVPKGSIRENIIKEKHCGGLGGHFGLDNTLELVKRFYYWPRM